MGIDDGCICRNIEYLEDCYVSDSTGYDGFIGFLNTLADVPFSQANLDMLNDYCFGQDTTTNFLPESINIPPYLECGTCKTCDEVEALKTTFDNDPSCSTSDSLYWSKLTNYLNYELGFTLYPDEYKDFLDECSGSLTTECEDWKMLCPKTAYEKTSIDTSCYGALLQLAADQAELVYNNKLDSLIQAFKDEYLASCLSSLDEVFDATGAIQEYHYTLYYYDQAGNLVKTIPPKGVTLLSGTDLDDAVAYRNDTLSNTPVYPVHTYETEYRYNTLNKVKEQISPDAEREEFWYDYIGRLVFSQDGYQRSEDLYSYTRYDEEGRVVEVGQIYSTSAMTDAIARDTSSTNSWLTSASNKEYVTRTFYDEAPYNITAFGSEGQENLRRRVATSTFEEVDDGDDNTYDYGTHYSYDVTGNVKSLVQEFSALHTYGHGYKRIDYDYDFISGNVNAVYYQLGKEDQFTHRYFYDDNNRITRVQTSPVETTFEDAFFWEEDATYEYYLHGPLSRTELGHYKVQGMDYAYTLQGWIKGLNSSLLDEDKDMGQDGNSTNKAYARDAFGYTIGYYDGDYDPIGSSMFEASYSGSGFDAATPDLYNGNIRHIVSENRHFGNAYGYAYQYDQLHRLKSMNLWDNYNAGTFSWNSGGSAKEQHQTRYNYDANGNLTKLIRYGDQSGSNALMDSLTYNYSSGTNRLFYTRDSMAAETRYSGDFDDLHLFYYHEDGKPRKFFEFPSGSLRSNDLYWTPYDKVSKVYGYVTSLGAFTTVFGYDANQNRVSKGFSTSAGDTTFTYYVRDAQGNTLATYQRHDDTITLQEQYLFGSSRLGSFMPAISWINTAPANTAYFILHPALCEGWKRYEVNNHLGNMMAAVSDRKTPLDTDTDGDADYYLPTILAATDYYPFGYEMPGRKYNFGDYRYGFNGKEHDTDGEWGNNTYYDYGFRVYSPVIGKFLSVDPLTRSYPELTPYQFASNTPIQAIDLDGLEAFWAVDGRYLGKYGESTELRVLNSRENENLLPMIINNPRTSIDDIAPFIENSSRGYVNPDQAAADFVQKYNPIAHIENAKASESDWRVDAGRNRKEYGAAILNKEVRGEDNELFTIYVLGSTNSDEMGAVDVKSTNIFQEWERNNAVHTHPITGMDNGEEFSPYRNSVGLYGDEHVARKVNLYLGTPKGMLKLLPKGSKWNESILISNKMPQHPSSGAKGKPSFYSKPNSDGVTSSYFQNNYERVIVEDREK